MGGDIDGDIDGGSERLGVGLATRVEFGEETGGIIVGDEEGAIKLTWSVLLGTAG